MSVDAQFQKEATIKILIPSIFQRWPGEIDLAILDRGSSCRSRATISAIIVIGALAVANGAWWNSSGTFTKECEAFTIGKSEIGGCDRIGG
jgi:hypothetical protein